MTAAQMATNVKLGLDKSNALDYPSFTNSEIDLWLNISQDRFVKQRLYGDEPKKKSIINSTKRLDDLKTIMERGILPTAVGNNRNDGGIAYDLPADYLLYVDSETKITRANLMVDATARYVRNRLIIHKDLDKVLRTAYNNPILRRPCVLIENDDDDALQGSLYIYKDEDTTITEETLIYIRTYDAIVNPATPSELPDHTHQEIVDMTVNLLIENIESPRVKTNDSKLIGSE